MGELELWDYIGNLWKVERDQELSVEGGCTMWGGWKECWCLGSFRCLFEKFSRSTGIPRMARTQGKGGKSMSQGGIMKEDPSSSQGLAALRAMSEMEKWQEQENGGEVKFQYSNTSSKNGKLGVKRGIYLYLEGQTYLLL